MGLNDCGTGKVRNLSQQLAPTSVNRERWKKRLAPTLVNRREMEKERAQTGGVGISASLSRGGVVGRGVGFVFSRDMVYR